MNRPRLGEHEDQGALHTPRLEEPGDQGAMNRPRLEKSGDQGAINRPRVEEPGDQGTVHRPKFVKPKDPESSQAFSGSSKHLALGSNGSSRVIVSIGNGEHSEVITSNGDCEKAEVTPHYNITNSNINQNLDNSTAINSSRDDGRSNSTRSFCSLNMRLV